jgi:hypothetical protein
MKLEKAMDLLPLPYPIPYTGVSDLCVSFTLFPNSGKDKAVLENLAELIGMDVEFSQGRTTHLIVNSDKLKYIDQSTKIQMIKRTFKDRVPIIVTFEWFLQ